MNPRDILAHIGSGLVFLSLASLAHWQLVYRGLILADYDAFVYFYANRDFTAARLLSGQLPLWNPYLFAGTPHLANPQSAVLYPGTWIFLFLPIPTAYTINLVLHTALAGFCMYALVLVVLGGSRSGSVIAGACYMLGGAITAEGGHLNQLSAASLLPGVLVTASLALRGTSVRWACATALLLTLQLLAGHPQVTYMTLVLMGLLIVWEIAAYPARLWIGQGLLMAIAGSLAVGLSAVQIFPTLEATRQGIRSGGLMLGEATASSLPPEFLPLALLPGYTENPPSTEFLGFIGAIGLTLAIVGLVARMPGRASWLLAGATLSLLLALGSNTVVFESLFGFVPGLDAFRVPARWLLPWTLCLSGLAGLSLGRPIESLRARRVAAIVVALILIALAAWAAALPESLAQFGVPQISLIAWAVLAIVTGGLWLAQSRVSPRAVAAVLLLGVAGEMMIARQDLPFSHAVPDVVWKAESQTVRAMRELGDSYRVLSMAGTAYQPESAEFWRDRYPWLQEYALEQLLTAVKWADVLTPNLPSVYKIQSVDGYDGGVFPTRRFVLASSLLHPQGDVRPDGVLISSLDIVPRRKALDLFGIQAIVASYEKDTEVQGVRFDRAVARAISPRSSFSLTLPPGVSAQRLALLYTMSGEAPRRGSPVLELRIRGNDGVETSIPLAAGTGVPLADDVASGRAPGSLVRPWRDAPGQVPSLYMDVTLPANRHESIELVNVTDSMTFDIQGATILGESNAQQVPVLLDPSLQIKPLGDIRVYQRQDALPRAYIVHDAQTMADDDALVTMFDTDWEPSRQVLLEPGKLSSMVAAGGAESASITRSDPESVRVDVMMSADGVLVLSDAWYPGWKVLVDGRPADLLRANILFRAVELAPGQHVVDFVYDPATLRAGAVISAVSALALVAAFAFGPRISRILQ